MNPAPLLDYVVALNMVSVAVLVFGACVVLGCQFLGVAGGRGHAEGKGRGTTRRRSHET
jgi:hypothetical protein